MVNESIKKLEHLLAKAPSLLSAISEEEFFKKTSTDKWSKKEILGHLIDSATNNHQRFIRGQFEYHPEINYDQNKWNEYNYYQEIDHQQLVSFWFYYNKQLIETIKRISPENLTRQIIIGNHLYSIEFLIDDYTNHLEHHLKQLINL